MFADEKLAELVERSKCTVRLGPVERLYAAEAARRDPHSRTIGESLIAASLLLIAALLLRLLLLLLEVEVEVEGRTDHSSLRRAAKSTSPCSRKVALTASVA